SRRVRLDAASRKPLPRAGAAGARRRLRTVAGGVRAHPGHRRRRCVRRPARPRAAGPRRASSRLGRRRDRAEGGGVVGLYGRSPWCDPRRPHSDGALAYNWADMTFILEPGATAESPLLDGLNPRQREAVEYRGPSLLIVAGAGSGKTSVLTRRIAHLIETRDAWPSQILAITFTNKAASEMRERVQSLLGQSAEGMWISTFHSACVRILRREAEHFGYSKSFTIYDSADSKALVKRIIKDLDADSFGFTPNKALGKISKLKNELHDVESYARDANFADPAERVFLEIFREYTRSLTRANAFDFDDLIGQTVYLFRAFPAVAALYQRRFRHILVDEY